MTSIGETLRRERLGRGLDLNQVSRDTRITIRFLESIEADRFDKLPGGVFTRSFVRQYARVLGLDEDEIAAELQRVLGAQEESAQPAAAPPEPEIRMPKVAQWEGFGQRFRPSSSLPALAMVVVVMLICSGIYTWWQTSRTKPAVSETPAVATEANRAPAAHAAAPVSSAAVAPEQTAPEASRSPVAAPATPPVAAPVTSAAAKTELPSAQPPAEPISSALGDPAGPMHVALKATEPTWVAITLDGKRVYSGILQPNESKTLNASGAMHVLVGNAGGLDVTYNGKPLGPLGTKGQVKILNVTPEGAQVLAPKPAAPAIDTL